MKRKCRFYLAFATLFVMLILGSMTVFAEETITVGVTGTYGQTEARSMLQMINDFRTGDEAWQWNSDNTTKTVYSAANGNELKPLAYDYELEKVAMRRAMEIAISFAHTSPSGGSAFSSLTYSSGGENIAAGYRTAEKAFEGWQETEDAYSGQGHRRNMLSSRFTAVGIGHVYYNYYHYWVQVFRSPAGTMEETTANDSETTVEIAILPSVIIDSSITSSIDSLTMSVGDSVELPQVDAGIQTVYTWPECLAPVQVSCEWSADDTDCISIDSGKVIGNKIGTASISTTFLGNSITLPIVVKPISLQSASVSLAETSITYDGTAKTPTVSSVIVNGKSLTENTDYTVSWSDNINVGTATVTVTGIGNYEGEVTETFEIVPAEISSCSINEVMAQTYSGFAITPEITVSSGINKLNKDTDYTVKYISNQNVGTATITVTGIGNYTGTISTTFEITAADLSTGMIDDIAAQTYDGTAKTPDVSITVDEKTLTKDTDYILSFDNNIDAGTATVTATGTGNYKGEITKNFEIAQAEISSCSINEVTAQTYNGSAITPEIIVMNGAQKLVQGTDYTVEYASNQNVGTAAFTVTGVGNYTGEVTGTFVIRGIDLSQGTIDDITERTFVYDGTAKTPAVLSVTIDGKELTKDTDYTVSWENNINAGTAALVVTGIGNYEGKITETFEITPVNLSKGTINNIANKTYTGKAIKPAITVKYGSTTLKNGTDYKVTYSNNTKVGTATVTVTGTGNYTGTLKKNFKIVEPVTPAKGKSFTDKKTGAIYKITKAGTSKTATVQYVKPTSSKTTVTIPDTVVVNNVTCKVTSIAANAFKNNKKITTLTIGKNVTSIGKTAFYGCTALKKVTIGSKVTTIGNSAFYGCTKLSTLTIGNNVVTIDAKAFGKCTALQKVTIPATVKTIGSQAFYGCKNLKNITIKTTKLTTKTVGSKAFSGIYSKAAFKVPSNKVSAYKKLLKARGISSKATVTK